MEMPVRGFPGTAGLWFTTLYRSCRLQTGITFVYSQKRDWSTTPKEEGITGYWSELSPKEVGDFSATAYFFGDLLQRSLDIPVGLIHCSWSASKIETWMDKETLSQFPEIQLPDIEQTKVRLACGYTYFIMECNGKSVEGISCQKSSGIRGVNSADPVLYKKLFPQWSLSGREFFHNPAMPVYYVQITPWQAEGKDRLDRAWFRQCQLELMQEVPNVGMVTTTDAGSEKFIHPPTKIKVGQRLAYWALAKTYGKERFSVCRPFV